MKHIAAILEPDQHRFCHPSGWQWIETEINVELRTGSEGFCHPSGWQWIETEINVELRTGSEGFCHPSGWQWIETSTTPFQLEEVVGFLPSFGMAVD